jgi:hypothetical protein
MLILIWLLFRANHKRRPKGISAYEASDEESIAEFEKLEN